MYKLARLFSLMILLLMVGTATQCNAFSATPDVRSAGPYPAYQVYPSPTITEQSSHISSIRDDGTLIVAGEPVFPFGYYHVSWASSDAERSNALNEIAEAGFNTMYAAIDTDDDEFIAQAEQQGVYIITEFNEDPISVIERYEDRSIIISWLTFDDVDNGTRSEEEVSAFYESVKAADSYRRPVMISCGYPDRCGRFMPYADVVGFQSYPVPAEELIATSTVLNGIRDDVLRTNTPIWATLQAFAWADSRPPTPTEIRNMTYQALIAGSKGILYYTYLDPNWDIEAHPRVFQGTADLVPEIEELKAVLLEGDRTELDTESPYLYAAAWSHGPHVYVIVANTSSEYSFSTSLALPEQVKGTARPLFEDRPAGFVYQDGKLSGTVEPDAVHVYVLDKMSAQHLYLPIVLYA